MVYFDAKGNKRLEQLFNQLEESPESIQIKKEIYDVILRGGYEKSIISGIQKSIESFRKGCGDTVLYADVLGCMILYGASPDEYFEFRFDKLNHYGRSEYFCDKQRFDVFRSFYDFNRYETIRNKWNQYALLKKWYRRDCIHLGPNIENYDEFESFVKHHNTFIAKPVRAFHGDGIKRVRIFDNEKTTKELYEELRVKESVCDELIMQDHFFEKLHEGSVNTVRILAITKNGKTVILHPQLHIGRGSSIADNDLTSIRANINVETGIIYTPGYDHYMNSYIFHPDTNTQIVGAKIPKWDLLINDIKLIMNDLIGLAGHIGFDMALTEKGWLIVEINPFPQFYSQQLVDKMGYRREIERIVEI